MLCQKKYLFPVASSLYDKLGQPSSSFISEFSGTLGGMFPQDFSCTCPDLLNTNISTQIYNWTFWMFLLHSNWLVRCNKTQAAAGSCVTYSSRMNFEVGLTGKEYRPTYACWSDSSDFAFYHCSIFGLAFFCTCCLSVCGQGSFSSCVAIEICCVSFVCLHFPLPNC